LIKQAKDILENIGLIKKAGEYGASLLDLLRRLKNGKPDKVEKKGDSFEYRAQDGSIIPVSAPVNNLYNNGVVNNFILNIAAPAERTDVTAVKTFLKRMEQATGVQITKGDVPAIRAYVEPPVSEEPEVEENTTVQLLHPKSGNYGGTKGQWTFTMAGTSGTIKAKITDQAFLAQYTDGIIRFYAQDLLRARVHKKQTIEGTKVKVKNEIIEVLEYRPAHPSQEDSESARSGHTAAGIARSRANECRGCSEGSPMRRGRSLMAGWWSPIQPRGPGIGVASHRCFRSCCASYFLSLIPPQRIYI
jgi:hypothetical protein